MPKFIFATYTHDGKSIRNWININKIQSITDGDAPDQYRTIICMEDHKMFFDVRTPQQFMEDMRKYAI